MRVFLSWSGDVSKAAAKALSEWLPYVVPVARPWISDHDIQAGALWEQELAKSLAKTDFAILVLTSQNQGAPWLLFEAGVLAAHASLERIVPFLVGLPLSDVASPLTRFQAVDANEAGTRKLVNSLNEVLPPRQRVRIDRLATLFEVFWPRLKSELATIPASASSRRPAEDYFEEILDLLRITRGHRKPQMEPEPSIEQALLGLVHEISSLQGKIASMEEYETRGGGASELPWWEAYVERHRTALSLYVQALSGVERAKSIPLQN